MKIFLRIFWICFAWLIVLILAASIIEGFINGRTLSLNTDAIFSIIYLPMIIAIIGYAHRWRIWKSGVYFWRAYFFIFIASGIAQLWINHWLPRSFEFKNLSWFMLLGIIIPVIIVILMIMGVYLYAFRFLKATKEPLINSDH